MSTIHPDIVKSLREKTNAGIMDCKRALLESHGDIDKAEIILRKKGITIAGKKSSRETNEGIVASYIHMQGRIGVMVEVNCETDFVAKNDIFHQFVKDITLQIAASNPIVVSRDNIPTDVLDREKEIYRDQMIGKSENIIQQIIDGKLEKFYSNYCLIDQFSIKNPEVKISELLVAKIAELGENIIIRRFVRYVLGEKI